MIDSFHYEQPKHHVAVDCVIFGYENHELKLLLARRKFEPEMDQWSLIGGWVREQETVDDAAIRVLEQITGLSDIYLDQICVCSDPNRDSGGRVISIVFYALISIDKHNEDLVKKHGAQWWPFKKIPQLIFDHGEMVKQAYNKLRYSTDYEIIGEQLFRSKFTILQLRNFYEAVFQRPFYPGNFRRKILSLNVLEKLDHKNKTESKKGAYYYRFKKNRNKFMN